MVALLLVTLGLTQSAVMAGVVYTTSNLSASGPSGLTGNTANGGPNGQSRFASENTSANTYGYDIGTMGSAGSNKVITFNVNGANTIYPTIQFSTGTEASLLRLNGISVNLFGDNMPGAGGQQTGGTVGGGTLQWKLYQSGDSRALATFNQAMVATNINMSTGNNATSVNTVYQSNLFDSSYDLATGQTYYLRLESVTGLTNQFNQTGNGLHLGYRVSNPITGQTYSSTTTGTTEGAWTASAPTISTSLTGGQLFSFDLQATAVPEPGTMALGGLSFLAGVGGWWSRRKKKRAGPVQG